MHSFFQPTKPGILLLLTATAVAADSPTFKDKTLVAWVAPANLEQRGGSVLTLDDGRSHFDGIVFGEIEPRRWMPGSDHFTRTPRDQSDWPQEIAHPETFVQIAIVYRGREVVVYRNGRHYAHHLMPEEPRPFGPAATVLFDRRHLDATDKDNSFAGRIRDARIYDHPLDRETLAALQPGKILKEPAPWAWWSFGDEGLREKTGRFTEISLLGDLRLEDGCLVLTGNLLVLDKIGRAPDAPLDQQGDRLYLFVSDDLTTW